MCQTRLESGTLNVIPKHDDDARYLPETERFWCGSACREQGKGLFHIRRLPLP